MDLKLKRKLAFITGSTSGIGKSIAWFPDFDILINNLGSYMPVEFFNTTCTYSHYAEEKGD